MVEIIVDTNVPLVADGEEMTTHCQISCSSFMEDVLRGKKRVVIDDQWIIIREYGHKLPNSSQNSFSKLFYKYIVTHQGNPVKVKQVSITPLGEDDFEEFPESLRAVGFDISDRKFVAVAIVNRGKAAIAQAADSKWVGWEEALSKVGVNVLFLCKDELREKFQQKMG